jgi:hypothetical protein
VSGTAFIWGQGVRGKARTMKLLLASLFVAAASQAAPPAAEDAAHRADRLRTEALNRQAAAAVGKRNARVGRDEGEYRAAMERYERRMAQWRQRVRACEGGDWSACD